MQQQRVTQRYHKFHMCSIFVRKVNSAHVAVINFSIQENGYDDRRCLNFVTIHGESIGKCAYLEARMENSHARRVVSNLRNTLLVDGRQRFAALQELAAVNQWSKDVLIRITLMYKRNELALSRGN